MEGGVTPSTSFRQRRRALRRGLNAALLAAGMLLAAEARARMPDEVRLYEENDFFNWFTQQTDRYYTQGARIEALWSGQSSGSDFLPGITHEDWCRLACGEEFRRGNVEAGVAVGQNIYTPADITIARPQPYDRPWAGLLYGSRIARISYDEPRLNARRRDSIEVALGIVGPASLAAEAQTWWHEVIEDDRPAGWANQLRNEPVLQLRYETALRWPREEGGHGDVIVRARGNLGNALTSLEADATLRLGWNLSGFGVTAAPPAPPPPLAAMRGRASALAGGGLLPSANLFLRAGIKAVAHNIFLDGNSFVRNDIRIDRTPLVPELAAGVEVNLFGPVWFTFQFIHRGSEFETWRGRKAPAQEFGAITIAWISGD
jgi:lipid A 3-O-deacylase